MSIKIPLSFMKKYGDDRVALLLAPEDRDRYEKVITEGLRSDDKAVKAEAESLSAALDLDREAAESEAAVHLVCCFRTPTWADKAAIQGEALRLAAEAGTPDAAGLYEVPLRAARLLERVEDRDGKDIETKVPECLYDLLGRRLDPYLYTARNLTDFFVPAAKPSAASKRAPKSRSTTR